jgi:hypothetical protein
LALFSRRSRTRRAQVGVYAPPEPRPAPSIDALVDEGLLIVESGVRLAVKNQVILWALRDRADFDHLQYLDAVRERLLAAAAESAADADRLAEHLGQPEVRRGRRHPTGDATEPGRRERRLAVLLGLVARLRGLADDESYLAGLALAARDSAWEEIGAAVTDSALLNAPASPLATWDERDQALAEVRFELERLEARRPSP